jgi:carbonic anhydrase
MKPDAKTLPVAVAALIAIAAACARKEAHESPAAPPAPAAATAQEAEAATTRPVAAHAEAPHWSYEGESGPSNWSRLASDYAACAAGRSQSPIDIVAPAAGSIAELRSAFPPAELEIERHEHSADAIDNGHTIQVNYSRGDTLTVGDERFDLVQYHFHAPSEHTVAGKHWPMEMHLVHQSATGKLAVIGVLIEEGANNAAFEPIWSGLPEEKGVERHFENVAIHVDDLLPKERASYRYEGSLTTPPCSEDVEWFVMTTPVELSSAQIGAFTAIFEGNNRPTQPLHGRLVASDRLPDAR